MPSAATAIHHFGVLIPSANTTLEAECRLLAPAYQAHVGRLKAARPGPFGPSRDEDIDYQAALLGTARVEAIILTQTSASFSEDTYDEIVGPRMADRSGAPAILSAQALGRAARALGVRRIGIVSPYSTAVNEQAARYFGRRYDLEVLAVSGFGATESYEIGRLGAEHARSAFVAIDRPEIEAFVVPGGNFATMTSIAAWEEELGRPVISTNQASFWALLQLLEPRERLNGLGRLLAELPPG